MNLIHSLLYYYPIRDKIIQFTGESRYTGFITKATKDHRKKVLSCWDYKEKVERELTKGHLRQVLIPIEDYISHQYYSENKLVKIYFVGKYKRGIESTEYYLRNDSILLGIVKSYHDSTQSIYHLNNRTPQEIYYKFIINDTLIDVFTTQNQCAMNSFYYLAKQEYQHANSITLNLLKLRYPCSNEYLPN